MKIGDKEYFSIGELSEMIGMTKATVNRWLGKYKDVSIYDLGKAKLINEENLEKLLQARTKDVQDSKKKKSQRMKQMHKDGTMKKKKTT